MDNILEDKSWRILIIIDACRRDYFQRFIPMFMEGVINHVRSPGSCTLEWLINTMDHFMADLIYVSGNPYINRNTCFDLRGHRFCAKEFIYVNNIIEGFNSCWAYPGTTDPVCLSELFLKTYIRRGRGFRYIIHYLQPHAPYIGYKYELYPGNPILWAKNPSYYFGLRGFKKKLFKFYRVLERRLFGIGVPNLYVFRLRDIFGFPPALPTDAFRRRFGLEELPVAYAKNLVHVLRIVSTLTRFVSEYLGVGFDEIVITTDHGECLGEHGWIDHPCFKEFDELRETFVFRPRAVRYCDHALYNRFSLLYKLLLGKRRILGMI